MTATTTITTIAMPTIATMAAIPACAFAFGCDQQTMPVATDTTSPPMP